MGRKRAPFYRIVAVDSRKKAVGEVLEILGTWNIAKKQLKVNGEKIKEWVGKGAKMSATVKKLVESK